MSESLKQEISGKGWAMKPAGFIALDLKMVSEEFERAYAQGVVESTYENVASLNARDITKLPAIAAIFDQVQRHMHEISVQLRFEDLWLVSTKPENVHAEVVPFVPHIDKHRYMKAMIYLDDVGADDGPFSVVECPPAGTDAMRQSFGPDYKEKRQNVIDTFAPDAYKPCTGAAGSVIFFDTNCPHFAGHVRGDGRRRVFRFDFTDPTWNPVPLRSRLAAAANKAWGVLGMSGN